MNRFVICISNESNPASLILGKVYRTLPDASTEADNMLRVIDEDRSEPVDTSTRHPCSHRLSCRKWPSGR